MVIPADLPRAVREKNDVEIPIHYNSADEPSQITYLRLREVLDRWKRGIVDERPEAGQAAARATPSRSRSRPWTWRPRRSSGAASGPDLPVPAGDDVADRGLLPGGRPLRGREGAGDDGDPADQPGVPRRDRAGQVPHGHAGQRDDGAAEPGEHGADRHPARRSRSASAMAAGRPARRCGDDLAADARSRPSG